MSIDESDVFAEMSAALTALNYSSSRLVSQRQPMLRTSTWKIQLSVRETHTRPDVWCRAEARTHHIPRSPPACTHIALTLLVPEHGYISYIRHPSVTHTLLYVILKRSERAVAAQTTQRTRLWLHPLCGCWRSFCCTRMLTVVVKWSQRRTLALAIGHGDTVLACLCVNCTASKHTSCSRAGGQGCVLCLRTV